MFRVTISAENIEAMIPIVKVMAMPDVREKLASMGFDPVASTPEEFTAWIRSEIPRWAKVIRDANIQMQ